MKSILVHSLVTIASLMLIAAPIRASDGELQITEAQINRVFESFEKAAKAKSVEDFARYMATDIKIIDVDPDTDEKRVSYNDRATYIHDLTGWFASADSYSMEHGPLEITIASDGRSATVKHSQKESWSIAGQKSTKTTFQSYSFVLEQGQLVIRSVTIWLKEPK